jgi:hypothetical protein
LTAVGFGVVKVALFKLCCNRGCVQVQVERVNARRLGPNDADGVSELNLLFQSVTIPLPEIRRSCPVYVQLLASIALFFRWVFGSNLSVRFARHLSCVNAHGFRGHNKSAFGLVGRTNSLLPIVPCPPRGYSISNCLDCLVPKWLLKIKCHTCSVKKFGPK